jgi:hypothetical protein
LVIGVTGFSYAIEASTNLVDWSRLQTNTSPFEFKDNAAGSYDRRFLSSGLDELVATPTRRLRCRRHAPLSAIALSDSINV